MATTTDVSFVYRQLLAAPESKVERVGADESSNDARAARNAHQKKVAEATTAPIIQAQTAGFVASNAGVSMGVASAEGRDVMQLNMFRGHQDHHPMVTGTAVPVNSTLAHSMMTPLHSADPDLLLVDNQPPFLAQTEQQYVAHVYHSTGQLPPGW